MTNWYMPPVNPHMNDALYISLGGFTGSSTAYMRNVAYAISESQIEQEIGTFLFPTTVTGTFDYPDSAYLIQLPVGMINSVNSVVLFEQWTNGVDRLISGTAHIYDPLNGYITVGVSPNDASGCLLCTGYPRGIYKAEISITAGYATGTTVGNPIIDLSLKMASDIVLQQMYDEGMGQEYWQGETTVQIGRYIRTSYTKNMRVTAFGVSHKAQFISKLLDPFKITKVGKVGR